MTASESPQKRLYLKATEKFFVLGLSDGRLMRKSPRISGTLSTQRVFLDVNDAYTRNIILKALRNRSIGVTLGPGKGMEEVALPSDCDFQWAEYERIDWSAVLAGQHGASSYCVRKGLSRKAQLAHYTRLHVCKNPKSLLKDTIPKTIILDTWPVWEESMGVGKEGFADIVMEASNEKGTNRRGILDKCLAEAKRTMDGAETDFMTQPGRAPPMWILKPSTINKGAGIQIIHVYEQLVDVCWTESDIREWVLQEYVSPPLLLSRRKFHVRAYALAVSAIRVYLLRECLALCSGTPYNEHNTSNVFAHITNTAHQELDPNFVEEDCVRMWSDVGTILVQDGTCQNMEQAEERIEHVVAQMERITSELFRAYKNEYGVFAPIEGCFEHYGLDFMIRSDWSVFLLEVNPGPDFKQTGDRLSAIIDDLMNMTVDAAVDPACVTPSRWEESKKAALVYDHKVPQQSGKSGRISMKIT